MMEKCIFCKIVNKELPSSKIYEDEDYVAILDIMPNTKGMTVVMPKKHYDSYIFDMGLEDYSSFLEISKKVAKILEKGLNVKRVAMVMEGMGVNHAHIKLYPLHGLKDKFTEMWAPEKRYFENYEGYISTQTGPKKEIEELNEIGKEILDNQ